MKTLKPIILLAGFVAAIVLVFKGLRINGSTGLLMMLLGLCIILFELYLYNKQYQ